MFSNDDLAVTKISFEEKGWRGKRIVQEYPRKNWSRQSINRVINKLIETGSVARKPGSGRLTTKWSLLDDTQIQKSIGQWKQRLRVVTREGGGSIKHLFA